eukprot:769834-Rhodomonas_salina.1
MSPQAWDGRRVGTALGVGDGAVRAGAVRAASVRAHLHAVRVSDPAAAPALRARRDPGPRHCLFQRQRLPVCASPML